MIIVSSTAVPLFLFIVLYLSNIYLLHPNYSTVSLFTPISFFLLTKTKVSGYFDVTNTTTQLVHHVKYHVLNLVLHFISIKPKLSVKLFDLYLFQIILSYILIINSPCAVSCTCLWQDWYTFHHKVSPIRWQYHHYYFLFLYDDINIS